MVSENTCCQWRPLDFVNQLPGILEGSEIWVYSRNGTLYQSYQLIDQSTVYQLYRLIALSAGMSSMLIVYWSVSVCDWTKARTLSARTLTLIRPMWSPGFRLSGSQTRRLASWNRRVALIRTSPSLQSFNVFVIDFSGCWGHSKKMVLEQCDMWLFCDVEGHSKKKSVLEQCDMWLLCDVEGRSKKRSVLEPCDMWSNVVYSTRVVSVVVWLFVVWYGELGLRAPSPRWQSLSRKGVVVERWVLIKRQGGIGIGIGIRIGIGIWY